MHGTAAFHIDPSHVKSTLGPRNVRDILIKVIFFRDLNPPPHAGRFPRYRRQRKPLVSAPGMHHGTCVTHVPRFMSGAPTRGGGKNVPGISRRICNPQFYVFGKRPMQPRTPLQPLQPSPPQSLYSYCYRHHHRHGRRRRHRQNGTTYNPLYETIMLTFWGPSQ